MHEKGRLSKRAKDKVGYAFYTLMHPLDGFYEIRHRGKGSVFLAVILVMLFSFAYSMNQMLASFVVNDIDPRTVDSFDNLMGVLLLYALFCVGNWSVTCLMNGEGRLKDIASILGYALIPMIFSYLGAMILSQFIAADEEAFYYVLIGAGVIWSVFLAVFGIMTIHNYTIVKTMLTLFLTFVSMFIIIFIVLMLYSLMDQVYGFFYSVYIELSFR